MYSHVNITPVKGRGRGGVTVSRVLSETRRFSPSDWSIRRGVKQVTWWCVVIVLRGLFYPPDTPKPILFVQYGHSCIDLYLCGLNIKHNCVLKKHKQKRLASYFAQWEDTVSWSVFQVRVYLLGKAAVRSSVGMKKSLCEMVQNTSMSLRSMSFHFSKAHFKGVNLYIQAVPREADIHFWQSDCKSRLMTEEQRTGLKFFFFFPLYGFYFRPTLARI